jgi:glycosyltransferase involved in cell wall biosynthesis
MYKEDSMNCLLILPRPVFPLVSGYSLKNYNLIRLLAGRYRLKLVIIADGELSMQERQFYQELSVELHLYRIPRWKSYLNALFGLFSSRPLQVCYYYDKKIQEQIQPFLEASDVWIAALVRTREYLNHTSAHDGKVIVFDMVDSIALNYMRSQEKTSSLFWKALYKIEGRRLLDYEKKGVEESSVTYLFNPDEHAYWKHYGNVHWLPHGVNEALFTYSKHDAAWKNAVVFIGKMNYQPNVDAIIWYMEHVHPQIGDKVPLIIVGAYPTEKITTYAERLPNVTVTGFVDDPYIFVASAMAVIAPMQTGGGIQNKVLEGMALGKVCVVSSLAAKPIAGAAAGEHLLVADTPEEYRELLLELSEDRKKYAAIGTQARELIRGTFTWENYGQLYLENIEDMFVR